MKTAEEKMRTPSTFGNFMPVQWLPDWRREREYPDPKNTSTQQWAWEFLRRNLEYQSMWQQHIQMCRDGKIKRQQTIALFKEKFGIVGPFPPHPSLPIIPKHDMRFVGAEPKSFALHSWRFAEIPSESEMVFYFDLRFSLEPQLAKAHHQMKTFTAMMLHSHSLKLMRPKARPSNFRNYLRVLDAKTEGKTDREIGEIIYAGQTGADEGFKKDKAREAAAAARKLRDGDYKFLVIPKASRPRRGK